MMTGIFRPVLIMPAREFTDSELEYIFLHELTHLKHRDILFKWLALFINAVHWFNPFMYVITAQLNESCECFCDETVTKNFTDARKKEYMNTILSAASPKQQEV